MTWRFFIALPIRAGQALRAFIFASRPYRRSRTAVHQGVGHG